LPSTGVSPTASTSTSTTIDSQRSIDPATFAVNLWAAPAAEVAVPAAPVTAPPPPPLNIQLIGIITETDQEGRAIHKAALYDIDSDRLLILADGERLREHNVRVLAGGIVELKRWPDDASFGPAPECERRWPGGRAMNAATVVIFRCRPDRFYWGVLDVSDLPRQRRRDWTSLGYLFESMLPLSIEHVQAMYSSASADFIVACGMLKQDHR
jgi:hypothetical protein